MFCALVSAGTYSFLLLTDKGFGGKRNRTTQGGRYIFPPVFLYVGINIKTQHTTKNTHPHHGELPPPPAARILQLDQIQRKPDADEGLGEGAVEAIQWNR